jgi:hypothetical protein
LLGRINDSKTVLGIHKMSMEFESKEVLQKTKNHSTMMGNVKLHKIQPREGSVAKAGRI